MKILVLGAGAVGSVMGARLSATGHSVELVGRPDHVAAIRANGLRIEGTRPGTFRVGATPDLALTGDADAVILGVKTTGLATAAAALGRRFPHPVPTLLPQNGLFVERSILGPLRAARGTDPGPWVVRAVTLLGATLVAPGVVRQVGNGELLFRDPALSGDTAPATRVFVEAFAKTGIVVRCVSDLDRELWRKAIVNAAINPVTALERVPNGRLLEPPYREEALRLLREAQRAAAAAGYSFTDAEADADLDRVLRATADNRSSMLQDIERGRPTEIDAISGEIVRVAEAHGIDLPATRAVVERLRGLPSAPDRRGQPS
ncbi:MAG: 2-dehydropantoate 2-reductase [Thermoplasmata archaeon]